MNRVGAGRGGRQRGRRCALWGAALLAVSWAAAGEDPEARQRRRTPIVEVFEKCRDAVVNISTTRIVRLDSPFYEFFNIEPPAQRINSVGSGVVIHESGYIVTNAHVVARTSDIRVTFADNRTYPAEPLAVDPQYDLAVLKIEPDRPLKAVRLGRSDDLMVGETVVAIGNPLGLQHTVTAGIISALNRELRFRPDMIYKDLIQTDAAINPGNSGGPLLNINGELIGINTAIRGDAQNVGFAIPVDRLWELLPSMLDIERRQRVVFGARVSGPDAQVVAVRPDSPAARAGLKPQDRILRFGSHALRDGIDYYVHLLQQKPGAEIPLTVQRGDRQITMRVRLERAPPPDARELGWQTLGMRLAMLDASTRARLGLPSSVTVVVDDVQPDSPADQARIRPGDIILRMDRHPVRDLDDARRILEGIQPGQPVIVEGLRLLAEEPFNWTVVLRARAG